MLDLITRIEAAKEPRRELFEEAFRVLIPKPDVFGAETIARLAELLIPFNAMLDARAWTSAAEMFAGDRIYCSGMGTTKGPGFPDHVRGFADYGGQSSVAAHPSLALLAAILRAESKDDE